MRNTKWDEVQRFHPTPTVNISCKKNRSVRYDKSLSISGKAKKVYEYTADDKLTNFHQSKSHINFCEHPSLAVHEIK